MPHFITVHSDQRGNRANNSDQRGNKARITYLINVASINYVEIEKLESGDESHRVYVIGRNDPLYVDHQIVEALNKSVS